MNQLYRGIGRVFTMEFLSGIFDHGQGIRNIMA